MSEKHRYKLNNLDDLRDILVTEMKLADAHMEQQAKRHDYACAAEMRIRRNTLQEVFNWLPA